MKVVQLNQGKTALVDDDDFERVSKFTWFACKNRYTFYAQTKKNKKTIMLHRLICDCPKGYVVDHINGDGLDNRKCNLRIVSMSINAINSKIYSHNTSGIKGVYFHQQRQKWIAQMGYHKDGKKKTLYLVAFDNRDSAATAYRQAVEELHGQDAIRR